MKMDITAIDVVCDGQRVAKSDQVAYVAVMKSGEVRRIPMDSDRHLHDLVHTLKYEMDKIVVLLRAESQVKAAPVIIKHNKENFWKELAPALIQAQP
jgi:hypothetical protein